MLIILGLIVRKEKPTRTLTIFRRRRTENQNAEAFLRIYGSLAPERYTYSSLKKITNSFEEKLGEGGYATVYKGKLSDGRYVAVKLFKQLKGNGEDFINEVASIGRTNHVNIVSLLGFCYEGNERALIYEFMPNGSLEKFTFDKGSNRALPRGVLFNIVDGIAKGLDYLHQGCNERILHFDIKPHNILLDEDFCPKISDFGLARLCPQQESTISMLEARGTIGYIAPEVFCRSFGNVSHKSDVYSYGVMVLDLVCGRTNACTNSYQSSELYFTEWIYNQLELDEEVLVDGNVDDEERCLQRKMILVSLWCIQLHPSSRPSMSEVVELLNRSLELIPMPPRPCLSSFPSLGTIHSFETLPSEPLVTPISN